MRQSAHHPSLCNVGVFGVLLRITIHNAGFRNISFILCLRKEAYPLSYIATNVVVVFILRNLVQFSFFFIKY